MTLLFLIYKIDFLGVRRLQQSESALRRRVAINNMNLGFISKLMRSKFEHSISMSKISSCNLC